MFVVVYFSGASASPSMRDAIQGMLSMSQMGGLPGGFSTLGATSLDSSSPSAKAALKFKKSMKPGGEDSEKMPTCYKDEEYGGLNNHSLLGQKVT